MNITINYVSQVIDIGLNFNITYGPNTYELREINVIWFQVEPQFSYPMPGG